MSTCVSSYHAEEPSSSDHKWRVAFCQVRRPQMSRIALDVMPYFFDNIMLLEFKVEVTLPLFVRPSTLTES